MYTYTCIILIRPLLSNLVVTAVERTVADHENGGEGDRED